VTYVPYDPDFTGHDTFRYEVQDAASDTAWAKVDVYLYWIDLDVNSNGSLLDAVDGTDNYLPGYVGEDDVLSTGTEFSDWHYLGQQMRVIVEGIGFESDVQQVTFQLLDVTNYDGYSENTSDASIEGSGQDNDLSFAQSANQDVFVVTDGAAEMEQNRSWAPLWAKDYGAAGKFRVDFQIGTVAVSQVKSVFKDEEILPDGKIGDGLPDKWEEAMVTEWNARYGTSIPATNAFFGPGDDKEPKDPDGPGAVFHSTSANANISISDIRPDRSSGTITVVFVNAVASSGLSISTSTSGSDTTITVELVDDGTSITVTADDVIDALNTADNTMFLVFAEATSGVGTGTVSTVSATALKKNALAHKTKGDGLTVLQEFRGFVLDSGPLAAGVFPIPIHTPLSPAKKELLVEVDSMQNVPWLGAGNPEGVTDKELVRKAMDAASKGFSNETNGAGIYVYYVLDQLEITSDTTPKGFETTLLSAGGRRNPALSGKFVHLILAERRRGEPNTKGVTIDGAGSIVYVNSLMKNQPFPVALSKNETNFVNLVSHTIAHELTHAIVKESSTNGFDENEHVPDGNENGTPNEVSGDGIFLMATPEGHGINVNNWTTIRFSNTTLRAIDLPNKNL
jgi:hypothetical protein